MTRAARTAIKPLSYHRSRSPLSRWDTCLRPAGPTCVPLSLTAYTMKFRGNGDVWVQSRNLASLADKLVPFLPKTGDK